MKIHDKFNIAAAAIATLLSTTAALAQNFDGTAAAISAPPDRSLDMLNPFTASLDVSTDDSELTLSLATKPKIIWQSDGEKAKATRRTFGIDISLPVGGKDDITDKATLNGLSNGTSITGKFVLFGASAKDNMDSAPFLKMHARAKANCLEEAKLETDDKKRAAAEAICNQQPLTAFTVQWNGASETSINRALLSTAWSLVFEGSVGWNDFKFVEPVTLADKSANKLQYGFGITGTLYPSDAMSTFSFGAKYQRSFEADDEAIICKPVVSSPDTDCKKGVPTAPTLNKSLLLQLESRAVFKLGAEIGELGIAPIATWDALDSSDYGLELPIYWIPKGESPILPGIKVGYSAEDDEVTFGIFLKTSFGL